VDHRSRPCAAALTGPSRENAGADWVPVLSERLSQEERPAGELSCAPSGPRGAKRAVALEVASAPEEHAARALVALARYGGVRETTQRSELDRLARSPDAGERSAGRRGAREIGDPRRSGLCILSPAPTRA
jgi:hypothetical protein